MTAPVVLPAATLREAFEQLFGPVDWSRVGGWDASAEVDHIEPWSGERDADQAVLEAENRGERQAESALDWLERGGRR